MCTVFVIISCHWNIKDRERDIPHAETQGKGFCFCEILTDCSMKLHQNIKKNVCLAKRAFLRSFV